MLLTKTLRRRAAVALLIACVSGVAYSQKTLDPQFVGKWRATVTNQLGTLSQTSEVSGDGSYVLTTEVNGTRAVEHGKFLAQDGKWSLTAETGRADHGIYVFDGKDKFTLGSAMGTVEWHRDGSDAPSAGSASNVQSGAPGFTAPAMTGLSPPIVGAMPGMSMNAPRGTDADIDPKNVNLASAQAAAVAEAKKWKPGAQLVTVNVQALPDGTINLTANPNALTFGFNDIASGTGMLVSAIPEKKVVGMPMPGPICQSTDPIPDKVIDLKQALAEARKKGLARGMMATGAGMSVMAQLQNFGIGSTAAHGRMAWQISGMDAAGAMHNYMIEATTGAATTLDAATGVEEMRTQIKQLEDGKPWPAGTSFDFTHIRGEADAWAAKWNPEAKLFKANLTGSNATGSFVCDGAMFYYFAPSTGPTSRGDWDTCEIWVTPEKTTAHQIGVTQSPGSWQCVAAPATVVSAETAVSTFWTLGPNIPPGAIYLQLVYSGERPNGANTPPDSYNANAFGVVLQDNGSGAPHNRWLWRMMARRARNYQMAGMNMSAAPALVFIYVDAIAGEALSPAAAALPTGRNIPGKVGPRTR